MSKRTRLLLIALAWLFACAWCWAITVSPLVRLWMDREAWPLGALTGFLAGRLSRKRPIPWRWRR